MATSVHSKQLPRPSKRKGYLVSLIILALFGVTFYLLNNAYKKISDLSSQVNDLLRLYNHNYHKTSPLFARITYAEDDIQRTKQIVQDLSSLLDQYRNDLLSDFKSDSSSGYDNSNADNNKVLHEIFQVVADHSQQIRNIQAELETSEKVLQSVVTSQVAEMQKHQDMSKSLHDLQTSISNRGDANTIKTIANTYDKKLEDMTKELAAQRIQLEKVAETKENLPEDANNKSVNRVLQETITPKVETSNQAQKVNNAAQTVSKPVSQAETKGSSNVNSGARQGSYGGGYFNSGRGALQKGNNNKVGKDVDEATKKMIKKIEKRAGSVSRNIEKVKNAIFNIFG